MTGPSERVAYTPGGIKLTAGKRLQVAVPRPVFRARLTGLLFDTNKAFLLPAGIHGMRALKRLFDERKDPGLLITGHTDRAGADEFNLTLSSERAENMSAYLRDAVEEWFRFYGKSVADEKRWGEHEDRLMLGQVVPADKLPDAGSPPPASTGNVKVFQQLSNEKRGTKLAVDGVLGDQSRRALIAAYMAQPETSLPSGVVPLTHGCGPFHNEVPTAAGVAEPRNRRAEIFFFDGPVKPSPRKRCPAPSGCPEYPEWVRNATRTIDLDRGAGKLTVQVKDEAGKALEGAAVHLDGPFSEDAKTDATGAAAFADLPAGAYTVAAAREGFDDGETTAVVGDGSDVVAPLTLKAAQMTIRLVDATGAKQADRFFRVEGEDGTAIAEGKSDAEGIIAVKRSVPNVRLLLDSPQPVRLRVRRPGSTDESSLLAVGPGADVEFVFQIADARTARIVDGKGVAVLDGLAVDAEGKGTAHTKVAQTSTFALVAVPANGPFAPSLPACPVRVEVSPDPAIRKFKARAQGTGDEVDALEIVAGQGVEFVFEIAGAKEALLMEVAGDVALQTGEPNPADDGGKGTAVATPEKTTAYELTVLAPGQRMAISDNRVEVSVRQPRPRVTGFFARTPGGDVPSLQIQPGEEVELVCAAEEADFVQLVQRPGAEDPLLGAPVAELAEGGRASIRVAPTVESEFTAIAIARAAGVQSPESSVVSVAVRGSLDLAGNEPGATFFLFDSQGRPVRANDRTGIRVTPPAAGDEQFRFDEHGGARFENLPVDTYTIGYSVFLPLQQQG